MEAVKNIIVTDESALHLYLHSEGKCNEISYPSSNSLLKNCATSPDELTAFNHEHPLYGGIPVSVLVNDESARKRTKCISVRSCTSKLPPRSFLALRNNLLITSPQLTFVRMSLTCSEVQLAEIGMNLCARYYLDLATGKTVDRSQYLTTPSELLAFATSAVGVRGSVKASRALRWVLANSGSPYETKTKLVFCNPMWSGGLSLPFTEMNFDIKAGRMAAITRQNSYSIDLANPDLKFGIEYDGQDSHTNSSADKQRRNELSARGWTIYPIEKDVIHDPDACVRTAYQIAKHMGIRLRKPRNWEDKYIALRQDLDLPV